MPSQIEEEQNQWKTAEQCTAHAARKAREAEALAHEAAMLAQEAARAKEASDLAAQAAVRAAAFECHPSLILHRVHMLRPSMRAECFNDVTSSGTHALCIPNAHLVGDG